MNLLNNDIIFLIIIALAILIFIFYHFIIVKNKMKEKNEKAIEEFQVIEKTKIEIGEIKNSLKTEKENFEAEKKKSEEKNRKTWQMSEAIYKEKALIASENEKLLKEKEKLENEKKKFEEKNKKLWSQSIAIFKEKDKIEILKKEIEEKHHNVTESIRYAKRIQKAILPTDEFLKQTLPNAFVLYRPKDIVSGDFYWIAETENTILIAAADCTGHGVPGAFMSTLCIEKLNEAVTNSDDVSVILQSVNNQIKKVLHQSSKADSTHDGMDVALVSLNFNVQRFLLENQPSTANCQIEYAGANRPLWLIRKGQTEIEEIKATKVAIGGFTEDEQIFTKHKIELKKGDTIYIFSDGFADQFNSDDKKLMTRMFKEIVLSIQDKSMDEQKVYLNSFIENWKGNIEQTDDILVIGIRIY